jgi:multidrug efflux system outer membrane protein
MTVRPCFCLIVAILAGCAGVPVTQHPPIDMATPVAWTAQQTLSTTMALTDTALADSLAVSSWWQDLGDSTLARVIEEGLTGNHDLAAATHRIDMVVAQARIVGAASQPQVAVSADGSRSRRNFIGFPIGPAVGGVVASTTTGVAANLLVSWEVDLWGRLRAGQKAALADVGAAQADLAAAHLSLAAQIAHLYFAVIEGQHQLDLAASTVTSQERSARQIEDRYNRGLRTSLDLRLARSSAASARATAVARRVQLDGSTRQLEILLGRYPAATFSAARDLPQIAAPVPVGLPAELLARRPDLAAGERRLTAAELRIDEARRSLLPRISLTASGGRSSEALGDLLDGDYSVWNLVTNISQPLLQGGRLRAQVELASSHAEATRAEYAAVALRAFAEVESTLAREAALVEQQIAMQVAVDEAGAAERLVDERYARGLSDYIALLESQRRAFEARSQLLSIRRQRLDARIDLYVALGGGFGVPESSSSI